MDKTKIAIEIFDKYAECYQGKYMSVDLYHDTLDFFCDAVKKQTPDVLEIACGPGNITRYLLKKRPDFNILATDLSTNMIALAKVNNPSAKFEVLDCRDLDKINIKYDAIVCGFGLPYVSKEDAIKLIKDASDLLKSKGIFYLSTMEDDYTKSGFQGPSSGEKERIYIHYHQADYLKNALKKNSLKIVLSKTQEYPDEHATWKDLIIISKKK